MLLEQMTHHSSLRARVLTARPIMKIVHSFILETSIKRKRKKEKTSYLKRCDIINHWLACQNFPDLYSLSQTVRIY